MPENPTRRDVLVRAGKKAIYVSPVVLVMHAKQAAAGSGGDYDSTCADDGSPCTTDAECCVGYCHTAGMSGMSWCMGNRWGMGGRWGMAGMGGRG